MELNTVLCISCKLSVLLHTYIQMLVLYCLSLVWCEIFTCNVLFLDEASTFGRPLDTLVVHRESPLTTRTSLTESPNTEADSHDEIVPLIVSRIVKHVERNGEFFNGMCMYFPYTYMKIY